MQNMVNKLLKLVSTKEIEMEVKIETQFEIKKVTLGDTVHENLKVLYEDSVIVVFQDDCSRRLYLLKAEDGTCYLPCIAKNPKPEKALPIAGHIHFMAGVGQ